MNKNLLAVYGTLKKGYYNYDKHLKGKLNIFSGYVSVNGKLFSNGSYPILVSDPKLNDIFVEVYEVSNSLIEELDSLENPYNLFRKPIAISDLKSDVDIYIGTFPRIPKGFTLVKDGNWSSSKPFIENEYFEA